MKEISRLSDALYGVQPVGRPLNICVVTSEILGPVKNGGIGTATSGIVEHLASDGHKITVTECQGCPTFEIGIGKNRLRS